MSKVIIENVSDFNLDEVFDCGQCFRWNKEDGKSYTGVAGGRIANFSMSGDNLIIDNITPQDFQEFWRNYLDFDTDYGEIKKTLKENDDVIGKAIAEGEGIRILNQEVWETIISFIISANNNIPRIKGCIESLCKNFGRNLGSYKGKVRYAFPTPIALSKLKIDDLVPCKLGYRARYIIETAKAFIKAGAGEFENLISAEVPTEEAYKEVLKLSGVGPKVANCILLFSMKKRDSFPIDVWMKKVMAYLYGFDEEDTKAMETFAKEAFGENAGIAQQYLFYYMRNKNMNLENAVEGEE